MRKLNRSTLHFVVLLLIVTMVLSGCGGSSNKGTNGEKKIELTWLVKTSPTELPWEKEMIKGFEELHPNVKIQLQTIPYEEMDQRLATMIAGGKAPDIWSTNWADSGFATYQTMGALLDLTPYYERDAEHFATINPKLMNNYKVDDKLYGIPMLSLGSFLFYNKDLFDQAGLPYPPTNWDDQSWNMDKLLEYAQKLTHDVGNAEKQVFGITHSDTLNSKTWLFGGDLFRPEAYTTGVMGKTEIMKPINVEAITFFQDLMTKYKVSPDQSTLTAASAVGSPFLTSKLAMDITGGWGFWAYKSAEFRWGVAAVPWHENRSIPLYVDPWNISKTSQHPDEAWEFIKYLTDPKGGAKAYMEATNATPADSSLMDDWYKMMADITGMKVEEIKEVNEGAIKYGRGSDYHLISKYNVINNTVNQSMGAVWDGKKSVQQGLQEIEKNLEALNLK